MVRERWTAESGEVGEVRAGPTCSASFQVESGEEFLLATMRDGADVVVEDIVTGKFSWNLVISSVRNSKELNRTYKRRLRSSYGRKKEDNGHESALVLILDAEAPNQNKQSEPLFKVHIRKR